jgi:hypothetical protein
MAAVRKKRPRRTRDTSLKFRELDPAMLPFVLGIFAKENPRECLRIAAEVCVKHLRTLARSKEAKARLKCDPAGMRLVINTAAQKDPVVFATEAASAIATSL